MAWISRKRTELTAIISRHRALEPLRRAATPIHRRVNAVKARLERNFVVLLVVRTVKEMSEDDATHIAAGVAYYALFSLFPLMLALITLLSLFLESADIRATLTDFAAGYLPGSEGFVTSNVNAVLRLRGALGIFAVLGLLWSGSAIFGAIARAVNRAWDVHEDRPIYINKPRQLVMALAVGALFLLSLGTATIVRVAERIAPLDLPGMDLLLQAFGLTVLQGGSFLLTLCIFLVIYKFLPNTKTYWRYIWPGALVGAVLFETAKNLFLTYINSFANFESVYGSLAPVIVLLFWAYVSSLILILGAELSSEYGRLHHDVDRGQLISHDQDEEDGAE